MSNRFDIYGLDQGSFFKDQRIIFLYGEINTNTAYEVCTRLKYLDYIDSEKEIVIEINSPGGEVTAGLAIIDTILCINAPVKAIACGLVASIAAVIFACCEKGLRLALPHSKVLIHQPLGGMGLSQASDIVIYADNIQKTKELLAELLASATSKDVEQIIKDIDRDYYMTAEEALKYGIVDCIIVPKKGYLYEFEKSSN